MSQIRYIPFGYMIKNGKYTLNEKEKEAVELIFTEYIEGKSLNEIAKQMTELGYEYREQTDKWDKCMIKRIIENEKYLGKDNYPKLIQTELFLKANRVIKDKTAKVYRTEFTETVRDKIFCKECGNRITRNKNTKKYHKWNCSNNCYSPVKPVKDEDLEMAVINVFNKVVDNPEVIRVDESVVRYEPSLEVTKKLNELNRLMESKSGTFDEMLKVIYECAEERYKSCNIDQTNHLSDTIIAEFKERQAMKEFDRFLFIKTVSKMNIDKIGNLEVIFLNGASLKHNIFERNDKIDKPANTTDY